MGWFKQLKADPSAASPDLEPALAVLPFEDGLPTAASLISGNTNGFSGAAIPTGTSTTGTPSWIASLSDSTIRTDMAAASASGTVTEAGMEKLFWDLALELQANNATLSSSQAGDLATIARNLNVGETASAYVSYITDALILGNAANATWTGGGTSSVALGNLAAGSSATQLAALTDKWFKGTDLPNSTIIQSGEANISITYSRQATPLYANGGPSPNDVNQGQLGDCYLLSSLAEAAYQNPSIITSMITDNGNDTYGIRFYVNGAPEYVTVENDLADGGTILNQGRSALWASLIEQGYAQLQTSGTISGSANENYGNSFSSISSGYPWLALEEITGATRFTNFASSNGTDYETVYSNAFTKGSSGETELTAIAGISGLSTATMLARIVAAGSAGEDVVLDSNTNAYDSTGKQTLVASHALSIYGYDSATGQLMIRNPWGTEPNQNYDTTFEVSLGTLLADGDIITIDNANTAASPAVHQNDLAHSSTASGWNHFIDIENFVASYSDLTKAFGTNQQAAQNWYNANEGTEKRMETFDGLDYVASYKDLINAFGGAGSLKAVQDAGASHYLAYGFNEGRSTTFNGLDYIASYSDLIHAFGADNDAGAAHYIEYGSKEGRSVSFDGLDYIASYNDLINAFGANEQAGATHFITNGNNEGRSTSFDGLAYIAQYTDLINAFGANNDAGAAHYIQFGHNEGRSTAFNVSAYETAHPDLRGVYASNDAFLTAYIDTYKSTGTLLT